MKRISFTLLTAILACFWLNAQPEPATASAEKPDLSQKPLVQTEIEAETLRAEITEEKGYLIGVGGVKLTATNLLITCNQIEVFTDVKDKEGNDTIGEFSSIQKIIATGNVKIVQDKRTATAGRAEVFPNQDFIRLDEDPIVYQNSITMDGTGAQLLIHRGNGRIEWIGDAANKIRFTGPPIKDFGFEENEKTIVPKQAEEDSAPENGKEIEPDNAKRPPENGKETESDNAKKPSKNGKETEPGDAKKPSKITDE